MTSMKFKIPTYLVILFSLLPFVGTNAAAQVQPTVHLSDSTGQTVQRELTIGNTLQVGLSNAQAWHPYKIVLRDDTGLVVAQTAGRTDGQGSLSEQGLFYDSGVVPCTPPGGEAVTPETPPLYQFPNRAQANLALAGLLMNLQVYDAATDLEVISQPIMLVEDPEPYFFFSDAGACLRLHYQDGEVVYLTAVNVLPEAQYRVFILDAPKKDYCAESYDFDDARPQYPTGSVLMMSGEVSTQFVPGPVPHDRDLTAIVRGAVNETQTETMACDVATNRPMIYAQVTPKPDGERDGDWSCPACLPPDPDDEEVGG